MSSNDNNFVFVATELMSDGNGGYEPLPPGLFTVEQAARYCQCAENTVKHYREAGTLIGTQVGNEYGFTREELDNFLKRQTHKPLKQKGRC